MLQKKMQIEILRDLRIVSVWWIPCLVERKRQCDRLARAMRPKGRVKGFKRFSPVPFDILKTGLDAITESV